MAVYVDTMEAKFGNMIMCHMMADTTEELLEMADKIKVNRKWIQHPLIMWGDFGLHFGENCVPDSVAAIAWKSYRKWNCGQNGMSIGDFNFMSSTISTWSDSLGCVTKQVYQERKNNVWVDISKCKFYWYMKVVCSSYTKDEVSKEYPCCGHVHTTEPN